MVLQPYLQLIQICCFTYSQGCGSLQVSVMLSNYWKVFKEVVKSCLRQYFCSNSNIFWVAAAASHLHRCSHQMTPTPPKKQQTKTSLLVIIIIVPSWIFILGLQALYLVNSLPLIIYTISQSGLNFYLYLHLIAVLYWKHVASRLRGKQHCDNNSKVNTKGYVQFITAYIS